MSINILKIIIKKLKKYKLINKPFVLFKQVNTYIIFILVTFFCFIFLRFIGFLYDIIEMLIFTPLFLVVVIV